MLFRSCLNSCVRKLKSNIQRIIFDFNFLTQEFKQTNVIFVSSSYDLIPARYFDLKDKEHLYNFTHVEKASHLSTGFIKNQDVTTLFNLNKDIFDFLSRSLWAPHFFIIPICLSITLKIKISLQGMLRECI